MSKEKVEATYLSFVEENNDLTLILGTSKIHELKQAVEKAKNGDIDFSVSSDDDNHEDELWFW